MSTIRGISWRLQFQPTPDSVEQKMWQGIEAKDSRVGVVDVDPRAIVTAMVLHVLERPGDVGLLVTSTAEAGRAFMESAEQAIQGDQETMSKVWIAKTKVGIATAKSDSMTFVHVRPIDLSVPLLAATSKHRYLIIVPDVDMIPGCYLRDIAGLSGPHISVVLNSAR